MRTIVIMPGGFHPFHAGHAELYRSAVEAFPNADVYVAATNDTKTRPFPFAIKEKLAKLAGVAPGHFIQVKSPFKSEEITSHYNPDEDVLIFVRSEKDKTEQPKPGGTKKDGTPAYFQPYTGKDMQPFSKHAYIAYLPTVEFGPGIKSATEIRNAWPKLDDRRKTAMVMSLYPVTQKNPKLAANVVKMLDMGMSEQVNEFAPGGDFKPPVPPKSKGNDPFGNDDRSKIVQAVRQLLKAGNKVDWKVPGQMGHVVRADDDGVIMKRWGKPYSKIHYSLRMTDDMDDLYQILMVKPGYYKVVSSDNSWNLEEQSVSEGEVVPFKQPSKTLTWQQVPKNILLLANDWFWASEDNSGLDATIDPEGYGNGTANDVKYITAKLQQQGWTIDFNDEYDGPGEFNLRLTNKRGQSVLLPIEDAQDFSGWAEGTNPVNEDYLEEN